MRNVGVLHGELVAALNASDGVSVDCGTVERADLAFVQLLISARRTARRDGKTLDVTNLSPTVRSALARAGLQVGDPFNEKH